MLSISETVDAQAAAARHKVDLLAVPGLFLVRTMLAGAYIGIGVLIMTTAGGPLATAGSPFTPLVQGLVFGVALTVVLVAGAELATSAMMVLTQGALRGVIGWGRAGLTLLACLGGNLLGSMLFALLVHVSGVVAPGTAAGSVLAGMIEHKAEATSMQLLVRGILCNLLVCLAVWSAARLRSEGARLVMVFGCVMVFITSGFEHVVANMTTFSLGLYAGLPGASVIEMARNIALVGLGNLIGGALLVGAAYAYGSRAALPHVQADTSGRGALPSEHVPADASRTDGLPSTPVQTDTCGTGALPSDRELLAIR